GVLILSKPEHKIIGDSKRESNTPGHFAAAVYEVNNTRTIVIGYYGISANDDRSSARLVDEMSTMIQELQHLYQTRHVILAGDFNAVLVNEDANSHHNRKPQTTRKLLTLMEDYLLQDAGTVAQRTGHTWFRKNNQGQSSRIDMIMTNIQMQNLNYDTKLTIFDHAFLTASFGQLRAKTKPAMKDYILSTDEYIIKAQDITTRILTEKGVPRQRPDGEEERHNTQEGPLDENITFNIPEQGQTALHVFTSLIHGLQQLHTDIYKRKTKENASKLKDTSQRLFELKKELKKERQEERKTEIHEEITNIQRNISNEIEAKDKASQTRITNFYRTGIGRLTPETFYCIKEPNISRNIHKLEHEGRTITDQNEIVEVMQKWYEQTAERLLPQTTTLPDFLQAQRLQLPQLTEQEQDIMQQEFTMDEVKEAIKEAKEVSAPGPTGQTIGFYKLIFMNIPHTMTEALNQLVFNQELAREQEFEWIQERKVVYIPKKPQPKTPSDYRPLSMLEVLYKIPSRILARRLSCA
ncbi:MAG: hypothetical protein AN484_25945, partial [Aphanizomenon flos-aquae WA102]